MIESTLEEWKIRAQQSTCVRKGETVFFREIRGVVSAGIPWSPNPVWIGNYFLPDNHVDKNLAGKGWIYDDNTP